MIQSWMMKELREIIPKLTWTYDNYSSPDHTGTVYSEGGWPPSASEVMMRYPNYQVWIRSSDWDYAQYAAHKTLEHFHRMGIDKNFNISIDDGIETKVYRVFSILAAQDPIQIGPENDIMRWSINFDATLLQIKEEHFNAGI
ncbi:hypothetical protein MHB73_21085 [Bacillus sp. FSL K6-6483]|uniref:Uncharacterized protein n=1 Tax=Shouchella clausii (strain KSM-K16) TaxID=66692 RepID=Q5WE46_SHOC1|nr:hypothetical protein [Shouchella clausii]PAF08663.1 hypothetical protein CHH65_13830 [Shouchella clausii]BAD65364.1 hypothetical protein ABC2830 [Shouchella clausii KSM-K16]